MKLKIRLVLIAMTIVLMATSLGAVAAFVLIRNNASSRVIDQLQIDQAATEVGSKIANFLEKGPLALTRMQRLVDEHFLDLDDSERMVTYLIAEMRADRDLTWLSYSKAQTGAFIGVTRREGMLVLNRAAIDVDGGKPREWEIRADGTRVALAAVLQVPYDPRTAPWFLLGLQAIQPRWTDLYKFAEGQWGVSTVLRMRSPSSADGGGVATADFHLRVVDDFLSGLRIGRSGRATVIVPQPLGDPVVLGGGALPPETKTALDGMKNNISARDSRVAKVATGVFGNLVGNAPIVMDTRALTTASGRPWFLAVMVPAEEINGPIQQATRDTLLVILAFLALGVVVAVGMARLITRPIWKISEDMRRVGELHLSTTAPAPSFINELDMMGQTLAAMKACLRSFALYVPRELVRATLSSGRDIEPGGEIRTLTVMFTDVADFTKIAEPLSPEQASRELGSYFDILEDAITECGGLLDKFMGDGTMALFNAPNLLPDHAARACEAALTVQEHLVAFNTQRQAEGMMPFHTRIGLALGQAMVGNIGSSHRLAYTAIGDVVNLSSHLESLSKVYGTAILADGAVWESSGNQFEWRHLDRVAVAGREALVELYELLGRKGEVDSAKLRTRDLHEAALGSLIEGDFDRAELGFTAIVSADPRDHAAGVLLAYTLETRQTLAAARASGWRGVHVYTSKRPI
ncbi:adenylate/guanylate cyclase domain-containing protein [Microvirga ossetica]|nr:adenylate/guanylate cyclase domain-containing protein [Microvirga ossetica]